MAFGKLDHFTRHDSWREKGPWIFVCLNNNGFAFRKSEETKDRWLKCWICKMKQHQPWPLIRMFKRYITFVYIYTHMSCIYIYILYISCMYIYIIYRRCLKSSPQTKYIQPLAVIYFLNLRPGSQLVASAMLSNSPERHQVM